jgi:hypothetical protein
VLSVAAAADGATSKHSAQGPPRDADGARRSTRRKPTGAPSRDARQRRATGASTPWPSAETAGAPTSPRLMPARREAARSDAKGWRSPSPTWRQRGKTSQPEEPPTDAQETPRGEMEVEKEHEPAPEEAMEE